MIKNCYTIFITPPKTGKTKQFPIYKGTFYILIFLFCIFIIGDCIAILKYCESVKLKKENILLKAEKEKLKKVAKIVDELKKDESFIRHFLGLEKSGSHAGSLGMGGVDPNFIDSSCIITRATDNKVSYEDSEYKVLPIEEALLLKRNLQELIDELIDRKGEWDTKPAIMPVKTDDYWISSGFGWRKSPFTGLRVLHRGLDISARRGTPIIAPADGKVITAGKDLYLGKFIKIKHNDKFTTLYGHLLQREVKKGQKVKRGDTIGLMGNTGLSTGYHLHYEVRKDKVHVNPRNYILNFNTSNTMIAMY